MSKIKVAVIGVGGISFLHIEPYINNPNVELYAFCDINEKTLKAKGEKYAKMLEEVKASLAKLK